MMQWHRLAVLAAVGVGLAVPVAHSEEITLHLWSRSDRSGPLRSGNIVAAAEPMNAMLKAAGSKDTVKVDVFEGTAAGYDADALDLLKAFSVDKGPDLYVAAHEWIGEFARSGHAMDLDQFVAKNDWAFGDVIPILWDATKYQGKIFAIPQDTEVRMFFVNKDMLRKIGKDAAFIDGLAGQVADGSFKMADLTALAKEVVDKGAAKYGILHRPNVGPDYLMPMKAFGVRFADPKSGKLMLDEAPMRKALAWFADNVKQGVTPSNVTSMSWDELQTAFKQEQAFIYLGGVWNVPEFMTGDSLGATWPTDQAGYDNKIGWLLAPAGGADGKPLTLSHPIVYAVNPKSPHADLAAMLVAVASLPAYNVRHAVGSGHLAISYAETAMPSYQEAWNLLQATPMLQHTSFMPNDPDFGRYNAILFKALQGIETDRLSVDEAIDFLKDELSSELGDKITMAEAQ